MKKLNEAELFINKLNACNEPILTKEGTKHAIEIIDQQNKEIERLNNIIKEVREFVEWHYEDNKNFYKNKGIGLNYPECDYILQILNKGDDKE